MRFVERQVENGQEVVVLRYAALFYWLVWPTVILTTIASVMSSQVTTAAMVVAWIAVLCAAIPYWPITLELKRRMRDGAVTASGSKFSFANPLTYRWPI